MTARFADSAIAGLLKRNGLRDTRPRRLVIAALQALREPASPAEIQQWIAKKGGAVDAVTVYRILDVLQKLGLTHRHPCSGAATLCALPGTPGHHGFLHCTSCGRVQEYCDASLCKLEDRIAKKAGYSPTSHVSEILGLCPSCRS